MAGKQIFRPAPILGHFFGLAGELAWDTRDSTSMPNEGKFLNLAVWLFAGVALTALVGGPQRLVSTYFEPVGRELGGWPGLAGSRAQTLGPRRCWLACK